MKKAFLYITGIIMILSLMGCGEKGSSEGILSNYRDDISWEMDKDDIVEIMGEATKEQDYTLIYEDEIYQDNLCNISFKFNEISLSYILLEFTQDDRNQEIYGDLEIKLVKSFGESKEENGYKIWEDEKGIINFGYASDTLTMLFMPNLDYEIIPNRIDLVDGYSTTEDMISLLGKDYNEFLTGTTYNYSEMLYYDKECDLSVNYLIDLFDFVFYKMLVFHSEDVEDTYEDITENLILVYGQPSSKSSDLTTWIKDKREIELEIDDNEVVLCFNYYEHIGEVGE